MVQYSSNSITVKEILMKRLTLNFVSLLIAAVQAAFVISGIIFLYKSITDPGYVQPVFAYVIAGVALVVNFFLTKLDSHVRGYAYNHKVMFWISFAVGYLRVFVLPFILIGIIVSFFTGNKSFAEVDGIGHDYPLTCLVYAVSSLGYISERASADSDRRFAEFQQKRKFAEEERRLRREAERERRRNLPHDTYKHGFCTTQFLPTGHHTIGYGGRRGMRITSQRAYISSLGRPTFEVTVYAPFDSDDARQKPGYNISSSARRWVEQEFKRYYSRYTNNYNSCVPIEDVHLIVNVSR